MIDWFVLLAPLVLLPIVLLFAFVGCVLDRTGLLTSVTFEYAGGLDGAGLQTITVNVQHGGGVVGPGEANLGPNPMPLKINDIHPLGGTFTVENIPLNGTGWIHCSCMLQTNSVGTVHVSAPWFEKESEESGPRFSLVHDGTSFSLHTTAQ